MTQPIPAPVDAEAQTQAPEPEKTVFYANGICVHRNELVVPTPSGPRTIHACKVLTMSPSYHGTIEGIVDLLNIGWAVMAKMEEHKGAEARLETQRRLDLALAMPAGKA